MKRHLRISYLAFSFIALTLGACGKNGLNVGTRSVYQTRAESSLRNITARVTGLKGVTTARAANATGTGIQDLSLYYANPSSSWAPYNNTFMRNTGGDELQECKDFLDRLPRTKAYYRARVILAVQCGLSASGYRDPMMTAMYRNSTNFGQSMWQYDSFWRYPQSYNNFQYQTGYNQYSGQQPYYNDGLSSSGQGFQFLNQYLGQGYIPQTITYR